MSTALPAEGAFRAGTLITIVGRNGALREIPVESLTPKDRLLTLAGPTEEPRPLRALHRIVLTPASHPNPLRVAPIRIRANAIAPGMPARDLVLLPEAMLRLRDFGPPDGPIGIGEDPGHLVPAAALLNDTSITRDAPADAPIDAEDIWFIPDLGPHTIILAEATAIGSAHTPSTTRCIPIRPPGAALNALRSRLAARATELGIPRQPPSPPRFRPPHLPPQAEPPPPTTTGSPEPSNPLIILAGGAEIPPAHSPAPLAFAYTLPARTGPVRIRARPRRAPDANDPRRFGVCVLAITLNEKSLPFDTPSFGPGFHAAESNDLTTWRWTNGDAWLVLPYSADPRHLLIQIADWHTALAIA